MGLLTFKPSRPSAFLVVFTLWLLVFSSASQAMILSPLLPQIGGELGIRDAALGTLVSAYSLMVGIFALLSGPVSDRFGRRRILLLGCGTMTVALLMHSLVSDYPSFLIARLFAGCAGGMLSGAAVSYIGDFFPYNERGWATGWVMSGAAFGQIVGIPLGIMLAGMFGFDTAFYMFAATMGLTFLTIQFKLPQPEATHAKQPLTVMGALKGYEALLRRREVVFAAIGYFLMYFGVSLFTVYLPTWLERTVGATTSSVATMFLFGGIANVLSGPQAGKLSDRVGRRRIILLACCGLATLMLITPLVVRAMWVAYPIFFLFMIMQAMRTSPYSALLTALVDDSRRGSLMSFTVAIGQLGLSAGSALAGPLFERGYGVNAVVGAASMLCMGILVLKQIPEPTFADHGRRPGVDDPADAVEPSPA